MVVVAAALRAMINDDIMMISCVLDVVVLTANDHMFIHPVEAISR
jgi:hypothetical protein